MWKPVLSDWYKSHPDGGVHSATGWALRSWRLPLPGIEPTACAPEFLNWCVRMSGVTLIRISTGRVELPQASEIGRSHRILRVDREFWLSDREVTAGQFLAFLDDAESEKPAEVDEIRKANQDNPLMPVRNVSWYDAVLFCNWLSRREGFTPCYRKIGKEKSKYYDTIREVDVWETVPDVSGYRLPTEEEWEYACRARATTRYSCGDNEELLRRYAVFLKNSQGGPECVGSKLCNAWGLFDMHGNVQEWSWDWDELLTLRRGGSWDDATVPTAEFGHFQIINRFDREHTLGFRIAASLSSR